jgi:hypothetical protein
VLATSAAPFGEVPPDLVGDLDAEVFDIHVTEDTELQAARLVGAFLEAKDDLDVSGTPARRH